MQATWPRLMHRLTIATSPQMEQANRKVGAEASVMSMWKLLIDLAVPTNSE
jgi:hypothetical protein